MTKSIQEIESKVITLDKELLTIKGGGTYGETNTYSNYNERDIYDASFGPIGISSNNTRKSSFIQK